jgi:hypothetical protein
MYPGEQELCRVAMAKVMEPHPWEVLKSDEEPRKFVRPHPEHEEAFGLPPFQSAQFLDREVRECGGAGIIGFR